MQKHSGAIDTKDKVSIAFEHTKGGNGRLVVICPGFFNSMANRWMRAVRDMLSEEFDTLIFDFRGHGKSKGVFSWTAYEPLDLEAVLSYARAAGYGSIGVLGFSLGAAVAVITASHVPGVIKSMVLVSTPKSFWDINYHFWEPEMFSDLTDNFQCGWEGKGACCGNLFLRKQKPLTRIKHIKDIPVLFIHGNKDWIIKAYHSKDLYRAYDAPEGMKELVIFEQGLHAERLIQHNREKMQALMAGWFRKAL